jgi:hypothetical protein
MFDQMKALLSSDQVLGYAVVVLHMFLGLPIAQSSSSVLEIEPIRVFRYLTVAHSSF